MQRVLQLLRHASLAPLSPADAEVVLANALVLRQAAGGSPGPGARRGPLHGKMIGLLCANGCGEAAAFFRDAATGLGAQVATIPPSLSETSSPEVVRHTARVLGRLYDAVACEGLAAALVRQVGAGAGVPVYDGIASPDHPTALLADRLDGAATPSERRRLLLQAVLVSTIV